MAKMSSGITPPPSDDLPQKGFDPQVTRQLFAFMKPYKGQIFFALFLMAVNSFAAISGPYLVKMALDDGIRANSLSTLRLAGLLYLAAALLQWSAIYFRVYLMAHVGQSIIYDLRSQLFTHLQELSLSFFNHYSVGRITVRVINDVNMIREFITWALVGHRS